LPPDQTSPLTETLTQYNEGTIGPGAFLISRPSDGSAGKSIAGSADRQSSCSPLIGSACPVSKLKRCFIGSVWCSCSGSSSAGRSSCVSGLLHCEHLRGKLVNARSASEASMVPLSAKPSFIGKLRLKSATGCGSSGNRRSVVRPNSLGHRRSSKNACARQSSDCRNFSTRKIQKSEDKEWRTAAFPRGYGVPTKSEVNGQWSEVRGVRSARELPCAMTTRPVSHRGHYSQWR
jgi:hypothetical protein